MSKHLHTLLTTAIMAVCSTMGWAQQAPPADDKLTQYLPSLTFDGIAPIYDEAGKRYLLPLSSTQRGLRQPKAVMTHSEDSELRLICGKTPVAVGDSTAFVANYAGVKQTFYVLAVSTGDTLATANIEATFLPVVVLNTAPDINGRAYTRGQIAVHDAEQRGATGTIAANLRYRGATAQTMSKKSFAIKLLDDTGASKDASFGGLREDNNWILDAMAVDVARMRNRVSTDLWNDFSTKPAHFANEKKAINGTRGFFVEVILNGSYHGLYCMTEKVDRKQLRLKKYKTDKTTGNTTLAGLLYKADHWSYETFMGHQPGSSDYPGTPPAMYDNGKDTWKNFEMAYPEVADGEVIDWAPLYEAVTAVASNDTAAFRQQAAKLFDLPVALDYFLFVELMLASDNHGKNMFYHIYDVGKSKLIGITPWDLDGTWGRDYYSRLNNTQDATQNYTTYITKHEHGEHTLFKRLREGAYPQWNEALAARYAELRATHFNPDSIIARFTTYGNLFALSGADRRERKKWDGVDNRSIDINSELRFIRQWVKSRVATLDAQYAYSPTLTHIATAKHSVPLTLQAEAGRLLIAASAPKAVTIIAIDGTAAWSGIITTTPTTIALSKGIYIVEGQKVAVP